MFDRQFYVHRKYRLFGWLMVIVVTLPSAGSVALYTPTMISDYVSGLKSNPYVTPTASGDDDFVLGQSYGWASNPMVPVHDLYGFKITGVTSQANKIQVVLMSGNHNTEDSGNWALQGLTDFLMSSDWHAQVLRDMAEFYVYPMVNPDGRYLGYGRSNPELDSLNYDDHNRVWNLTGISTIDVFTDAMIADTGGSVDYFFDFHDQAGSNVLMVSNRLKYSPYCRALISRLAVPVVVSNGATGMARLWAMSSDGLSATYACTPEFTHTMTASYYQDMGVEYGLVMFDTFAPEPGTIQLLTAGGLMMYRRKFFK